MLFNPAKPKKQMEYGYRFTGDESDLIASLNKVIAKVSDTETSAKKLTKTQKEELKKAAQEYEHLGDSVDKFSETMANAAKEMELVKAATAKLTEVNRLEAKMILAKKGSYEAINAEMGLLRIRLSQMTAEEQKATKEGQELTKRMSELREELLSFKKTDLILGTTLGNLGEMKRELIALRNTSFAGKSEEEILGINKRIGELTDGIADLRSIQGEFGNEFGSQIAGSLQAISAGVEGLVGALHLAGIESETVNALEKNMIDLIAVTQALGAIEDALAKGTIAATVARIRETAAVAVDTVTKWANTTAVTAQTRAEAARAVVTGQASIVTKAAAAVQWLWNAALAANPIGLVIVGVAALAAGIAVLAKSQRKQAEEAHRLANIQRINSEISQQASIDAVEERVKVEGLVTAIKSENTSKEKKRMAIKQLNEISPEYFKGITLEKNGIEAVAKAYTEKYLPALEKRAKFEAATTRLIEIERKLLDVNTRMAETKPGFLQIGASYIKNFGDITSAAVDSAGDWSEAIKENKQSLEDEKVAILDFIKSNDLYSQAVEYDAEKVKEAKDYTNEYIAALQRLRKESIESGLNFLGNFERLDTERQLAIEEVKKFEAEVRKAAKNAKKTLTKEEEAQIRTLYENTEREFAKQTEELVLSLANQGNSINRAIGAALSGGGGSVDPLPNIIDANAQKRLQSLGVAIGDGLGAGIPDGLASSARDSIDRFLGQFSAEELDFAKQQFGNFAGEIADAWVSSVDIQIAQNDRLIQAYDQRIAKQSEALSREFELLKAGFANNYDAEKQNLEALEAQREAARKKGEDLAKKAARRQILVDTAQQVSSLVTAAANIQKGTSSVPFVGVAIGLGLIATLIGAFSKFKAQAAKAAEIPKFGKGDSLEDFFSGEVMGNPHSGGGVPASAAGRPIELEGKEFVTNSVDAQEHKGFLHHLNKGKFRGVDLMELVAPAHSVSRVLPATKEAVKMANEAKSDREASLVASVIEKTFSSHLQKHGDRIVGAIGKKKAVIPLKDGHVEEWEEGGKSIRKVVHHV